MNQRKRIQPSGYRCICGKRFGSAKWYREHEQKCLQQRIERELQQKKERAQ